MAEPITEEKASAENAAAEKTATGKKPKQVRVLIDGPLGTQMLVKGDVTSDAEYLAILDHDDQEKVELVK